MSGARLYLAGVDHAKPSPELAMAQHRHDLMRAYVERMTTPELYDEWGAEQRRTHEIGEAEPHLDELLDGYCGSCGAAIDETIVLPGEPYHAPDADCRTVTAYEPDEDGDPDEQHPDPDRLYDAAVDDAIMDAHEAGRPGEWRAFMPGGER